MHLAAAFLALAAALQADSGKAEFAVMEKDAPLPCRIHLYDAAGKPVKAPGLPFWKDHFVCPGKAALDLSPGRYRYEIERGPEYESRAGAFDIAAGGEAKVVVELKRIADLAALGWWSGELHVHRPLADVELLMKAEDLHAAPVITWWNNQNLWAGKDLPARAVVEFDRDRAYHPMGGEDERGGGALLYFGLKEPLKIAGASREHPSPMQFLLEAKAQGGVHVDVEKPFWWDVPVWIASGAVDTIGLANNHMCRSTMLENEAWGRARDAKRLPAPLGNALWTQEIYYHILNAGLRLPPSAGSASGVLPNPVGHNRAYVHLGAKFSYEAWMAGLRAGRSFVTNGPLLRVQADGRGPGHVFQAAEAVEIELAAELGGREEVGAIEIIRDGRVERSVPVGGTERSGSLGKISFARSGWFLVRCLGKNPKTFRFASTAPWYVEIGEKKSRIHRESARFFLDWVTERMERIKTEDPAVMAHLRRAKEFWETRLKQAED